tara:strand:+ start:942 stop:1124 length:183 start_codon:yes stop_codon:yes gene_type:complete
MSKYDSAQKTDVVVLKKLNVKDTDFLLKLIMRSTFEGAELEVAHAVLTKLAEMHKVNLES